VIGLLTAAERAGALEGRSVQLRRPCEWRVVPACTSTPEPSTRVAPCPSNILPLCVGNFRGAEAEHRTGERPNWHSYQERAVAQLG
jgi:hypothetical protein